MRYETKLREGRRRKRSLDKRARKEERRLAKREQKHAENKNDYFIIELGGKAMANGDREGCAEQSSDTLLAIRRKF
jgi:hypothetical protein